MNINTINLVLKVCFLLAILAPITSLAEDTDGDGWTNTLEKSVGSSPNDRGSVPQVLFSPAYTLWNGFLGMTNILELVNTNSEPTQVIVSIYTIEGKLGTTQNITIPPSSQFDVIVNDLQGFSSDSYGVIKLEFEANVTGQIVYYKNHDNTFQTFDFAFPLHLSNPTFGESSVLFNTYPPSGLDKRTNQFHTPPLSMSNWLSIINLSTQTQRYKIESFDQSGKLLLTQDIKLRSFERRDLDGGHGLLGQGYVGSHRITPSYSNQPYLAYNSRYAFNIQKGRMDAAYSSRTKSGTGRRTAVRGNIGNTSDTYLEVLNTLDQETYVDIYPILTVEEGRGCENNIPGVRVTLDPHSQHHFSIAEYFQHIIQILEERCYEIIVNGNMIIEPSEPNSIIAQRTEYSFFQNQSISEGPPELKNIVIYNSREPIGSRMIMSYNTFINMVNHIDFLNISGGHDSNFQATALGIIAFQDANGNSFETQLLINGLSTKRLTFSPEDIGNSYGTVTIDFNRRAAIVPFISRELVNSITNDPQFRFSGQVLMQ